MEGGVVLVIATDEYVRTFFLQKVLKPLGYRILIANNEKQGLEQALLQNPDLILFGNSQADEPDLQFLTILKQSTCISPVVLLMATESKEYVIKAFKQGISDYLLLPVDVEKAQETIKRVITNSIEKCEREKLNQRLIMVEAVQITITTLSHYMNNYLTALDGNLTLLRESIQIDQQGSTFAEIVKNSQINLSCIKMVMQVLLNTTSISFTKYDDSIPMIDIRAPLTQELNRIENKNNANYRV